MSDIRKPIFKTFAKEIDAIRTEEFKALIVCAYENASDAFHEADFLHDEIKEMYQFTAQFIDTQGLTGGLRDLVLTAVLLSDITLLNLPADLTYLHPITVKPYLYTLEVSINKQMLDAVISIIESHEGGNSPSSLLEPKPGTPGHILAILQLAKRLPCVSICTTC